MKTTKINIILFALLSAMAALSHSSVILASGKEPSVFQLEARVDHFMAIHPDEACDGIAAMVFSGVEAGVMKGVEHTLYVNPWFSGGVFIGGTAVAGALSFVAYDICKKKSAEIARKNKKA